MGAHLELYVHLVWGTSRRQPVITSAVEADLHQLIQLKCNELRCPLVSIGGTADHVHILVGLHPSMSVARLVGEVKGFSSHATGSRFYWQRGYGAYTVAAEDLLSVGRYVRDQKTHHAHGALDMAMEPQLND